RYEVTKALWDEVYHWAITHGYSFDYATSGRGKAANHPAHSMTWYDAVKWCNARSEKEGRAPAYYTNAGWTSVYRRGQVDVQNDWVNWNVGYRLPTEAEWEKAARGGVNGQRFPWGDTISHAQANYSACPGCEEEIEVESEPDDIVLGPMTYDVNPSEGFHPAYATGEYPYTSPVGSFAANGYGLYDMGGNVQEWCWRAFRGGGWNSYSIGCRSAYRASFSSPSRGRSDSLGFRVVRAPEARGQYQGIFAGSQSETARFGSWTASVTGRGTYSGKLLYQGQSYAFSGHLTVDLKATNLLARNAAEPLTLRLAFSESPEAADTGELRDGSASLILTAYRLLHSKANPTPQAGRYTIAWPGLPSAGPSGAVLGALRVNPDGRAALSILLPDGSKLTHRTVEVDTGRWPVFVSRQGGRELLAGWIELASGAVGTLAGRLQWLRPADARSPFFPTGFQVDLDAIGSRYVAPTGVGFILDLDRTSVTFDGGDFGQGFDYDISLRKVTNVRAHEITLSFTVDTGWFSGKVVDTRYPHPRPTYRFRGAVLQIQNVGWGHVLTGGAGAALKLGF
ncbi:MAG TPA: SUMF1/EgtB/PvdO family nonheme iron enzyme, partial [Verrucomicrobiae bacterium]|nr:SUMF1/EgtB/PvdO family nonheme iron enzyme [Verrucomicrobiae bacterium]